MSNSAEWGKASLPNVSLSATSSPAQTQTGLRQNSRHPRLSTLLFSGTIAGIDGIAISLSVAVLIFSGKLAAYASIGIGLALLSSIIITLFVSLSSNYRGVVATAQEVPAVILALIATAIVAGFPAEASAEEILPTVLAAIALSSLATGVLYWLLGRLRMGGLVRFVPYPVIGGFLAATGWVLAAAGLEICAHLPGVEHDAIDWFSAEALYQWLAALVVGLLLFLASQHRRHYLIIPALFVGIVLVFFLVLYLSGSSPAEASAAGWLLQAPEGDLLQPMTLADWQQVNWPLLFEQLPAFLVLLVLSVLSILLNVSGIELSVRQSMDIDRELRSTGFAHLLGGLVGAIPGFHGLGLSVLTHTLGAVSRLVGILAALVMALPLVFGPELVVLLPKMLLGGLLVYMGLDFLYTWLWQARRRLPLSDYLIILMILLVSVTVGFLEGIGIGLIAALVLFVVRYLRVSVVKNAFSAATYRSRLVRTPSERQWLREQGGAIGILQLQGFLFFGTGQRLLDHWQSRVSAGGQPTLHYSIFDCRLLTGLDSSALLSLRRLSQIAEQHQIELIFSGLSSKLDPVLMAELQPLGRCFDNLDQAVQWCEDQLLQSALPDFNNAPDDNGNRLSGWLSRYVGDEDKMHDLLGYFKRRQIDAGQTLISQGENGAEMLLIASGQVTITLAANEDSQVRIRTMRAGSVVGEMSLYGDQPRTASVVADSAVVAYSLDRSGLDQLEQEQPELAGALHRAMVKLMAERLADTTALVRALAL